ncbi:nucleotidyltransferase [Capsulimonas corticalis]|uniref:Nucleotidyltransferase n=1 Tax=Capsulimonas corticalis TaxID=2219043 RepID=A0A402CPT7_9BACT|nr:mannose-1-phosphate guanyltransferase [Capsulimonas corticalis]BDI32927.1 nucleotidyltransferase [Capsulimonas corticalis]
MKAVVMAGGEGTRLRPLTSNRPKPLVPILNKPCMQHTIELLKRFGVTDIVVTLYYLADEIEGYFGDGSELGVNLIYTVEDTPLGTAGSVKKAEEYLKDDTFIIVSGDALTDIDLEKALAFHRERESMATLVLQHVENPLEFGVVITDEEGRIRRFLEKPSWGEVFSDTVNTGMYILEPSIFDYMEHDKSYDWSQDIFPQILQEEKPMFGYVMGEYWTDVGSLQQYRQAQYEMLQGKTQLPIEGRREGGSIWIGEGTEIDPTAQLMGPLLIGKNCRIKAGAHVGPETVIGDNCLIEEGAILQRAIVWDSNYIGARTKLTGCTICFRNTIKDDCIIQEGAVVGDRCHIDSGSNIRPLVKLWPDKIIEGGSVVTMSLIWGSKWQGSLFRNLGVSGIANVEMTPDFLTKLGASYGAFLKKGSTVITSRDSAPVCRMLKRALIAGLASVGANVLDNEGMPLPLSRHSIRTNSAAGGVHIRLAPDQPNLALVEFFDKNGIYLSTNGQRKIETIFYREDFGRTDPDEVGEINYVSRAVERYSHDFFRLLNREAVQNCGFKVVVDYSYGRISGVLPQMLGQLETETIALNAYTDPKKAPKTKAERKALVENLAATVSTLRASLGVALEFDGERLSVVDETGSILSGSDLLATFALLVARAKPGAQVAVPVTAPSSIETVMAQYGGGVIRTQTDVRSLMATAAEGKEGIALAGDTEGGFIFPEFHPAFDGLFSFAKLLEMLAVQNTTLSEVRSLLPKYYMASEIVNCPWEIKGRIMRVLMEDTHDAQTELIDGIKIYRDGGWTLVLPDASEPYFRIYAEAETQDKANEMVHRYVLRISALK